ncbi:flagellin N-terminal helical domain-containing protein [Falsibacillus albus]|uniref:Flagellin n=1 Tax=Falsibacillus albus TaxID=2478915 RepID=A0A3L7K156_9BACI|nr:flagellin [Falsibacillus albus]RLQ96786.1 hypothetical protein D9X91_06715 [Falsibacillus albus]
MLITGTGLDKLLTNKMKRTETKLQKTLEKLATGQRIRIAADDSSGLAISQKMRALVRGSHQAIRNVQDAHSLAQVADGAMQEITGIMQRMRELTVQAMNGTNTEVNGNSSSLTSADTVAIQNEVDQLKMNLSEIVHHTTFNGMKILSNKTPSDFIYENRTADKVIQLSKTSETSFVDVKMNHVGYNRITPPDIQTDYNPQILNPSTSTITETPVSYVGTTVADHTPRWSSDGTSILFSSSRDGGQYVVPSDGSSDPVENIGVPGAGQKMVSDNGLMRLRFSGSSLYLDKRSSSTSSWSNYQVYTSYNGNDGSGGFSFSPIVDGSGNTSFVFSDDEGNIQKVDVNLFTKTVSGSPAPVIPETDTLNLPPTNNSMSLPGTPNLYNLNTSDASLTIQKVNDDGPRVLTYWDGSGLSPSGGYYTISGSNVTFFGDAIIGNEGNDDAQDYYSFSFNSDGSQNDVFTTSIPAGAEIYNMHGENGPRSLKITVGGISVGQSQLLAARPSDVEGTNGVYVDATSGKIEFYGDLRPAYNESVSVEYLDDHDSRNGIPTFNIASGIDTYNLTDSDLTANRSIRVYVGGTEIAYDSTKTNGYTYENGKISLYGDARPDLATNPLISIEYIKDNSSTSDQVYGIKLNDFPEIYYLGSNVSPSSIRVYRNSGEEISYSNVDGYQYNPATNTLELYGMSRPDVGDRYTIQMIAANGDIDRFDDRVEVPLTHDPETYGTGSPSTMKVIVDGIEINYDSTKSNGFYYNNGTNKIELYGDARPDAGNYSNPDVEVYYVYESPATIVGNDSYDFRLNPSTLDYGVSTQTQPRAIRVYQNGVEVPFDKDDGYTYDTGSQTLSLHGSYRPTKDDNTGDFQVYSLTSSALNESIPPNSYVNKVLINGQEIQKSVSSSSDGYYVNGEKVEIVGNARPDISNGTGSVSLQVQYFDSIEIPLNNNMPNHYFDPYCEHETPMDLMNSDIDPDQLTVSIDGTEISKDKFMLENNKVVLKPEALTLNLGSHDVKVDYRARIGLGYEPNSFTYQVGANAGQNYNVQISSFDNMLRETSIVCVRNQKDAEKGLGVIDHALDFVLKELGCVGAVENTLDHMAKMLSINEETTTASMSRIQDGDIAKGAMEMVKQQILSQAQQAMASQIKQSQVQVLELLK